MKKTLIQALGITTLLLLVGDLVAAFALLLSTPADSAEPAPAHAQRTANGKLPVRPATPTSPVPVALPPPAESLPAAVAARPAAAEMPASRGRRPSPMTRKSMIIRAGQN